MKNKILTIGAVALVLMGVIFVLKFIIGGSEDSWICVNSQWVKHGNPRSPMPLTECGEEQAEKTTSTYTNKDLDFSLEIPQSWEGKYEVKVFSMDPRADSKLGAIMAASFDYLPQEGDSYMFFTINKVSPTTWEELQKEELFRGKKLAEGSEAVYYSDFSLDNPFMGGDGDTYQAMAADINPILATFKIANK